VLVDLQSLHDFVAAVPGYDGEAGDETFRDTVGAVGHDRCGGPRVGGRAVDPVVEVVDGGVGG